MKNVLYHFLQHKKINGTLFYCFEYFVRARSLGEDVKFTIYNISDGDLEMVKNIFRDRYCFDHSYLDHVYSLNSIQELYQADFKRTLILDIHSFKRTYMFIRNDIYCFSNETHEMLRSDVKEIRYYGIYPYQRFDHEACLKLNFDIFRPIEGKVENNLLISSMKFNFKDIRLPEELAHKPVLHKTAFDHHNNLFNKFDTLFYYHSDFDTNNRLIPECFFYGKEVFVQLNGKFDDSISRRYNDIRENGLSGYWLKDDDIMLRDFLS